MSKIYVLTTGCYSDYHVITATTDKEEAERLKAVIEKATYDEDFGYSQAVNIEEYEDSKICLRKNWFYIGISKEKDSKWKITTVRPIDYGDYYELTIISHGELVYSRNYLGGSSFYSTYVNTDTEDQARKIAYDKCAELNSFEELVF